MGRPVRVDIAVERGAYTPGSGGFSISSLVVLLSGMASSVYYQSLSMWPEFSVLLRRDNGFFHKSAPRSGNTVFIKGFNTSSGEDQVILCSFCHHCVSIFWNNVSLYLPFFLC